MRNYLSFTVLDDVPFVENHIVPLDEGKEVNVIPYNVIRSNHQVVLREEPPQPGNDMKESLHFKNMIKITMIIKIIQSNLFNPALLGPCHCTTTENAT